MPAWHCQVLCPAMPSFLWCQNRKFLSGGHAHMVYSEFVVSVKDDRFGDCESRRSNFPPCSIQLHSEVSRCRVAFKLFAPWW